MKRINPKLYSLVKVYDQVFHAKRIEPTKRVKCLDHVPRGQRHLPEVPRHVRHKCPIVGGISAMDLMVDTIASENPLLKRLKGK